MSLIPKTLIRITQVPTTKYPTRDKEFMIDFVETGEVTNSWESLTDTAVITLPKNLYIETSLGEFVSWQDRDIIAGSGIPLLLRGDKISISIGYRYQVGTNEEEEMNEIFTGYISKVVPKIPVEIYADDNMYVLKQLAVPNKLWTGANYTVESMLKEMIAGTPFTVQTDEFQTTLGEVRTMNNTVAQVLEMLHDDYTLQAFFEGNVLRCCALVYLPANRREYVFAFEDNIKDGHSLEYTRQDDLRIGIKAWSVDKSELQTTNADGTYKTKKSRLETTVGVQDGDIRTFYFWGITTIEELKKLAEDRLNKILFAGFRGEFSTFGLPWVRQGDAVLLRNPTIPEYDGTYLVKSVTTSFGVGGINQQITPDLRIDILSDAEVAAGL